MAKHKGGRGAVCDTSDHLTPLMESFCREYVVQTGRAAGADAVKAAGSLARADGSPGNPASVQASNWLKMPKIQSRIAELRAQAAAPVLGDLQAQIERNRQTLARLTLNPVSSPAWSQAVVSAVRALNEMIPGALAPTRQDTRILGDVRITVRREPVSGDGRKPETAPDAIEGEKI